MSEKDNGKDTGSNQSEEDPRPVSFEGNDVIRKKRPPQEGDRRDLSEEPSDSEFRVDESGAKTDDTE